MKNIMDMNFLKEKTSKLLNNDKSILEESAVMNISRIFYLSIISIPIRIIILYNFSTPNETPTLHLWSKGIFYSHLILLIFMIGFLITSLFLRKRKETDRLTRALQYMVACVIMTSGIALVTFDQLVTTNITPFILSCLVVGTILLIRPFISLMIFSASYIAYYHCLGLTISNPEILLSNRTNGITAVGIGIFLSIMIWRYNYTNLKQKQYIEMQQKRLEYLAYYDPLTDLPNRRFFDRLAKEELTSMELDGYQSVITILDVDDFKNINDSYGHKVGDNLLRELALLLKNNIRESDIISRYGGEEFIIVMPNTSLDKGYLFAERLRKSIMDNKFLIDSNEIQITASLGVSILNRTHTQDIEELYSFADKALYLAKNRGKNRVEIIDMYD